MSLFEIMDFIAFCMGLFFTTLDKVYIGEHSYLDIICALMYLEITLWFIMRVINPHNEDSNKEG